MYLDHTTTSMPRKNKLDGTPQTSRAVGRKTQTDGTQKTFTLYVPRAPGSVVYVTFSARKAGRRAVCSHDCAIPNLFFSCARLAQPTEDDPNMPTVPR